MNILKTLYRIAQILTATDHWVTGEKLISFFKNKSGYQSTILEKFLKEYHVQIKPLSEDYVADLSLTYFLSETEKQAILNNKFIVDYVDFLSNKIKFNDIKFPLPINDFSFLIKGTDLKDAIQKDLQGSKSIDKLQLYLAFLPIEWVLEHYRAFYNRVKDFPVDLKYFQDFFAKHFTINNKEALDQFLEASAKNPKDEIAKNTALLYIKYWDEPQQPLIEDYKLFQQLPEEVQVMLLSTISENDPFRATAIEEELKKKTVNLKLVEAALEEIEPSLLLEKGELKESFNRLTTFRELTHTLIDLDLPDYIAHLLVNPEEITSEETFEKVIKRSALKDFDYLLDLYQKYRFEQNLPKELKEAVYNLRDRIQELSLQGLKENFEFSPTALNWIIKTQSYYFKEFQDELVSTLVNYRYLFDASIAELIGMFAKEDVFTQHQIEELINRPDIPKWLKAELQKAVFVKGGGRILVSANSFIKSYKKYSIDSHSDPVEKLKAINQLTPITTNREIEDEAEKLIIENDFQEELLIKFLENHSRGSFVVLKRKDLLQKSKSFWAELLFQIGLSQIDQVTFRDENSTEDSYYLEVLEKYPNLPDYIIAYIKDLKTIQPRVKDWKKFGYSENERKAKPLLLELLNHYLWKEKTTPFTEEGK